MEVPLPPSPEALMGMDFEHDDRDELSLLIGDLGVFDEDVLQHAMECDVASGEYTTGRVGGSRVESTHCNRKPISQSVAEKRVERTRERNRRAQARYRQKMKDQCASLELQVQELQARVNASRDKRASLRHAHYEQFTRLSDAKDTLSGITVQEHGPQLAHSEGSPASPQATSRPSLHNAIRLQPRHDSSSMVQHNTMIRSSARRGLCTDPDTPPAPIHTFTHMAGLSYELVQRVASNILEDSLTCQSSRSVIEQCKQEAAAGLGCSAAHVCWFLTTYLQAAPGAPLSFSSSLSSPECVASFVLSFMCSGLEFGMVTAALDAHDSDSVYEAAADEHDPKRVRICSASSGASPSGSPCAQDLHHPSATTANSMRCDSPATPTHPPPTSPSGYCAPACAPCHGGNEGGHAWSGCVRSGVNSTTCARSAAAAALRAAVEPYAGVLPPGVLRRLLHATARQSRATVEDPPGSEDPSARGWLDSGCGGPADSRDAGGGHGGDADADGYHAGVTGALDALMNIIADAAEAVLLQLPALEERARGRAAPARQWLLDRSCTIMASVGLGYMETFRAAPRIIRRLAYQGVVTLISFYEVENMHAMLYRSLHMTSRQRGRMAAYWSVWERRKRELDAAMHDARAALRGLSTGEVPLGLLACISTAATAGSGGAYAGAGGASAAAGGVQLLGSCAAATAAARDTLEALWAAHVADADLYADTIDLQMQPALILGLDQVARVFSVHLMHDAAPVDFMALCQMAKAQEHREKMFQRRPWEQ